VKFFHPPHLYCVTALPSKTNTTANIGVKCFVSLTKFEAKCQVFVDPGAKVHSSYYCNIVLEKGLLREIRAICRHYRWTLQQDGAPGHTARTTMDYLKKEHINFIEPHMWPPNSPDINPVDYAIWWTLQQRVYHHQQFKTVEELKRAIVIEWQKLSQRFIDNSINEWRRHFEAVIKNGSGHIYSIATWLKQPHIILILSR